jgi:hypothetical protein
MIKNKQLKSTYNRLFNSTRIPESNCDILKILDILLLLNVDIILDENDQILSANKIAAMMKDLNEDRSNIRT